MKLSNMLLVQIATIILTFLLTHGIVSAALAAGGIVVVFCAMDNLIKFHYQVVYDVKVARLEKIVKQNELMLQKLTYTELIDLQKKYNGSGRRFSRNVLVHRLALRMV